MTHMNFYLNEMCIVEVGRNFNCSQLIYYWCSKSIHNFFKFFARRINLMWKITLQSIVKHSHIHNMLWIYNTQHECMRSYFIFNVTTTHSTKQFYSKTNCSNLLTSTLLMFSLPPPPPSLFHGLTRFPLLLSPSYFIECRNLPFGSSQGHRTIPLSSYIPFN